MRCQALTKTKRRGVVFTPPDLASYLTREIVSHSQLFASKTTIKVLDPALGEAELLLAHVKELKLRFPDAGIVLHGCGLDEQNIVKSRERLSAEFADLELYLQAGNFLAFEDLGLDFDLIIA